MDIRRDNWSKLKVVFSCFLLAVFFTSPAVLRAETDASPSQSDSSGGSVFVEERPFYVGRVTIIYSESNDDGFGLDQKTQRVNVHMSSGPDSGSDQLIDYTLNSTSFAQQKLHIGDKVIVAKTTIAGADSYVIMDKFRIPGVLIGLGIFLILAILFGGIRGITSLFGLAASLAMLAFGVVPMIMNGGDPLVVSLLGAFIIAVVSILLAHGFKKSSYIALGATILTLVIAVLFSLLAVMLAKLSGSGSEEAIYLQIGSLPSLNLQGLLLGGMIIGTLGVLDDVTTTQVASIEEISFADKTLTGKELYQRGLRIGREHIASLVNTLALAYAGASFPLFLLFAVEGGPPLWVVLNAEYVVEEVVRAIVGGAALVIAVPISTALAAWTFGKHHR